VMNTRIGTVSASQITVGGLKFAVAKTVKVTVNGKPGNISDLKPGYAVVLTVSGGTVVEVKFPAPSRSFTGVISKVSASQVTIGRNAFPVSPDVKVSIAGRAGKIADLKDGDQCSVELSPVRQMVVTINQIKSAPPQPHPPGTKVPAGGTPAGGTPAGGTYYMNERIGTVSASQITVGGLKWPVAKNVRVTLN